MTYTKNAHAALPTQTNKTTGSPSPEINYNINNVPRDLKFKPIAFDQIKKVAEVLDFSVDE